MYKYLNQFFFYRLSVLIGVTLSLLNLSGCQDSSTASSSLNTQSTVDVVEASPFIETRSDFVTVEPNIQEFVDIRQFISSKSDIVIDDIKVDTVSQHEGQPMMRMTGVCNEPVVELNGDKLGFYVQLDSRNLCSYRYKVSGQSLSTGHRVESQFSTLNFFATTDKDPKLEIISKHGLLSDEQNPQSIMIDVFKELSFLKSTSDEWSLSEEFILLGDGNVVLNSDANSINYFFNTAGYARIFYTLLNSNDESQAKLGMIDISVGYEHSDGIIINNVKEFSYNSQSPKNLDIDISKYIKFKKGDTEYRLINVYSVDNSVSIKNKDVLNNKVFTFTWDDKSPDFTDVAFVLSNHKGSFTSGILRLVNTHRFASSSSASESTLSVQSGYVNTDISLKLELRDQDGNPVSGQKVSFKSSMTSGVTISEVKVDPFGTYTAVLRSKRAVTTNIMAFVGDKQLKSTNVNILPFELGSGEHWFPWNSGLCIVKDSGGEGCRNRFVPSLWFELDSHSNFYFVDANTSKVLMAFYGKDKIDIKIENLPDEPMHMIISDGAGKYNFAMLNFQKHRTPQMDAVAYKSKLYKICTNLGNIAGHLSSQNHCGFFTPIPTIPVPDCSGTEYEICD